MFSDEMINDLLRFRTERDWEKFHTPKNLAVSICIEAAELLEKFQWTLATKEPISEPDFQEIKDELADIAIYVTYLSRDLGIDLSQAVQKKLEKNIEKYPLAKAKGRSTKYNRL